MPKTSVAPVKPAALKWVVGISIFQIVIGVLACAFFLWLFSAAGSSEFMMGMREGVAEGLGKDAFFLSSSEGIGFIVGAFAIALFGPIFALVAVSRRSKGWAIASLIFNGGGLVISFSPLTLVVLVLMVIKPSREYLNLSK